MERKEISYKLAGQVYTEMVTEQEKQEFLQSVIEACDYEMVIMTIEIRKKRTTD